MGETYLSASDFGRVPPVPGIDTATHEAARLFLKSLPSELSATRALILGSRARGEEHEESDTDLAMILPGPPGDRWSTTRQMARLAFDIFLETDVFIDPLAIWELELAHPDRFGNLALIRAILRDGVAVGEKRALTKWSPRGMTKSSNDNLRIADAIGDDIGIGRSHHAADIAAAGLLSCEGILPQ